MKRVVKWGAIVVGVLVVIVLSLPFLISVDQFRPTLQSDLSTALGRDVTLGNLHLNWHGEVTADDLSIAEDPAYGKPAFLRAKSLHVGAEIVPFIFSRKLVVTDLLIDQPEIALVQSSSGNWNFSSLGGKSAAPAAGTSARMPLDLSVKLIKITNCRLTLRRTVGHWKPLELDQVAIELRDFSSASAFPFSFAAQVLGGGTIALEGKAGPINPADSAMTPLNVTMKVTQLDVDKSGMNDVAPGVAGLVSFDGSGDSDGATMRLKGKLKAEKLRIVKAGTPSTRVVEADFSVQHDLRKHSGLVQQGDVHIGSAVAHLTGSYAEQGDSMTLDLKLSGPGMPVQELEALLPAMGVVLPAGTSLKGGTASIDLTAVGPSDRLVTTGSVSLNNTQLAGFDLPKKMASVEKLAGIKEGPDTEIQVLSANVRSAPEGLSASDMKLVVPAIGDLSGSGSVSAENALDFKMSAIVHASGLLAALGGKSIPFTVTGTCSEPVFKPDIGAVAKEEMKSVGGDVGKAAGGLVKGFLGGKKK